MVQQGGSELRENTGFRDKHAYNRPAKQEFADPQSSTD
jgi:hypothetical protein